MTFETWSDARGKEIIAAQSSAQGMTLPILHSLQEVFGFIPEAAIPLVAHALNLSRAEVHGIVTFYHDFKDHPPGINVLKLCRAEACQSVGGTLLAEHVKCLLGIDWHETTIDRKVTLEPVFCLGLCACAPAAMWNGQVVGRLSPERIDALVSEARRG